jgi:hypothetical protein
MESQCGKKKRERDAAVTFRNNKVPLTAVLLPAKQNM